MESQPQNPEFRINPENFHPCPLWDTIYINGYKIKSLKLQLYTVYIHFIVTVKIFGSCMLPFLHKRPFNFAISWAFILFLKKPDQIATPTMT